MSRLKKLFFLLITSFAKDRTLKIDTWKIIKKDKPSLYAIQKERQREDVYKLLNNFYGSFALICVCFLVLLALCRIPYQFVDKYLFLLGWFKFKRIEYAYNTVSEVLGSAATIIGLSFVVIGFVFEIIRDKTKRTFEELFRATNLYFALAISVLSIAFLTYLNIYKYSVDKYTAGNFAILGSFLLFFDTISIAWLFGRVLRYLNPERIVELSNLLLLKAAKYSLLDDHFALQSQQVYNKQLESYGFEKTPPLAHFFQTGVIPDVLITLEKKSNVIVQDVCFPLLKVCANSLARRSTVKKYISLQFRLALEPGNGLFALSEGTKLVPFEKRLLRLAFIVKKAANEANDYKITKEQLTKRFVNAAESGNMDGVQEALTNIETLYDIYYSSLP